ncbi:MAG: hypothetical protein ACTII3_08545 [Galactobacter sp.]
MASPFDDPEFSAQAAAMGFRHVPGLAQSVLDDLRPILEADGVDLNNIGSPEELQAALNRATEQRNLMLSVPVGLHRELTLSVLKEFALLIDAHRMAEARQLLASVHPEEDDHHPAISHVLGVGSSLLDEWGRIPAYRVALHTARLPKWAKPASRTARALIDAGREHQAFDLHKNLIVREGGQVVYEAVAVATAAAVAAIARKLKRGVKQVANDLFPEAAAPIPRRDAWEPPAAPDSRVRGPLPPISGPVEASTGPNGFWLPKPGSPGPTLSLKGEQRIRELAEFLSGPYLPWPNDDEDVNQAVETFRVMVNAAEQTGHDLNEPERTVAFIASMQEVGRIPDQVFTEFACVLADYVDARFEENPGVWSDTREFFDDLVDEALPDLEHPNDAEAAGQAAADDERRNRLQQVHAQAFTVPAKLQLEALSALPVLAAVDPLIQWIGEGRPVTSTGQLRRVDIQTVMKLLGLSAVGVARMPPLNQMGSLTDADHPLQVLSAADIDILSTWWDVLDVYGLITRSKTRVYAGENPGFGFNETGLEELRSFLATYVYGVISFYLGPTAGFYEQYGADALERVSQQLHQALTAPEPIAGGLAVEPTEEDQVPDLSASDWHDRIVTKTALRRMETLETLGILGRTPDGEFSVPTGLRASVGLVVEALEQRVFDQR